MAVAKGLTQSGEDYLNSNDGLDISYGVLSTNGYLTPGGLNEVISDAQITYADIDNKIITGNLAVTNVQPAGALNFLDERDIPNPNNTDLILNTLFRLQDLNLGTGTGYTAKGLFLLYHDPVDLNDFSDDIVVGIVSADAADTVYVKSEDTVITSSIPLIYDTDMNPALVSLLVLQEVTAAAAAATRSARGTVEWPTETEIIAETGNVVSDFLPVPTQRAFRLFTRSDIKNAVKDVVAEMFTGNTETGISVTVRSDRTIDFELSQEWITDLIGAMFAGNTETGGQLIFRDVDNTVDYVVKRTEYVDQAAAEAAAVDADVEQWWPET